MAEKDAGEGCGGLAAAVRVGVPHVGNNERKSRGNLSSLPSLPSLSSPSGDERNFGEKSRAHVCASPYALCEEREERCSGLPLSPPPRDGRGEALLARENGREREGEREREREREREALDRGQVGREVGR